MYLKSIEVQGFKSFANRIKFEFHKGITAIVGPNGSGKSNVADAVRWVLGEQRIKQLRGGKMEDVIFAGTENRKPLGFAYVAITLDNKDHALSVDYDEVTVSRRLFRSGESEYMINGSVCRLKDVNELFYDTGIGKEGYSIIGQGQIDKILSGKPEERRELFDEAAGIVKFKRRKAEAVKKLENEKQNLIRVTDILGELEKQVGPLLRQSEKARKYLKYKEELKKYDINMFLVEITRIKGELLELSEKHNIASKDMEEKQGLLEEAKKSYEELDIFIENLNVRLEEKREELNSASLYKGQLEGEIKVLNEQINSSKINDEHYKNRINAIKLGIEEYNIERDKLDAQRQEIKLERGNASDIQNEADSKVSEVTEKINSLTTEVEDLKNNIISLLNEKSGIKAKIQRYDTMLEQINIRKAELNQRMVKFQSDKDMQDSIITQLNEELKKVNNEIISSMDEIKEKNEKLKDITESIKKAGKSREENQRQYHETNSRLEALRNLTERYEGYGNSIKKIMELKEKNKGIVGVVADIIKTEKKYEVAIETALGGNIQNVVTNNENTAKDVIEYLKKNKYGRATFLPLSSIANKTGFTNERALFEKGVIGLACDLVTIDKSCENIAKYLLGRVVVVDNIDNALVIARKYNYSLRMVTLEGELLNAGGSLSGGAFKNSSNLLGRRRELFELEERIKVLRGEMLQDESRIGLLENEARTVREEAEKIKLVLNEQYILQNTVKMNLNAADEKKKEIDISYNDFTKENGEIAAQIADINTNYEKLNMELTGQEDKNKELEDRIIQLNDEIERNEELKALELKNNEELRLKLAGLTQRKDFVSENLARVNGEIVKLKEEQENIRLGMEEAQRDTLEKYNKIDSVNDKITDTEAKIEALEKDISSMTDEKEEQTKEHKDFFTKREQLSEDISRLDKDIFRINSQREKLEEANEKHVNYMWDEYEITYSEALELKDEDLDNPVDMKRNISTLRNEIKSLGDVNVNSIEEYKEVSERYSFLKGQHDDLVTAEETLEKIIAELDAGMRKQFTEKLSEIKTEFDKVFKILFGGGKGTIELADDEDILEASIAIISQPPGKKLQNMMQLSGGEKALTAIALLFAIQNLKPSPFCLLDEIEAALDDSNVGRYADYLHKLTDHTQFIVITHRRGTMAAADRLYGITMQEKGVSILVSVNLIQDRLNDMEEAQ